MNNVRKITLLLAGWLASVVAANAQLQLTVTNSFSRINKPIPDGSASGIVDIQMVNPGEVSQITDLKVGLKISGGFNGDLYCYLQHDSGRVVLLNRPGRSSENPLGYEDPGCNVLFSADVAAEMHTYHQGLTCDSAVSGIFRPDDRDCDPLFCVESSPRAQGFESFTGLNPEGKWTLFVADLSNGAKATLVEWSVIVTGLPNVTRLAARN